MTDEAYGAPRRRGRTGTKVFLGFLAIFLVGVVLMGGYVANLGRSFDQKTQQLPEAFPSEASRPAKNSPADAGTNILLLGADTRSDPAEGVTGSRADSIMVVHVPDGGGAAYVMSVMRDTWVTIPGHGESKINAALDLGGPALMVQTLEGLYDIRIDQVAEIDFEGFKGLTDALGGVTVDVPVGFTSNGYTFAPGPTTMGGEQALVFVRERYSFNDGDYQRVANQRAYIQGLVSTVLSSRTLTSPGTLSAVVNDFSPYVSVSEGLTAGWIAGLSPDLIGLRASDLVMFTVPTLGTGSSADGQSIVLADQTAMTEIGTAIREGRLDAYVRDHNL